MNHDETNPLPRPPAENRLPIAPELEARIVAWVAGEASPFEAAELARLVAAQPELAIFKRRIEAVHGLVAEAARPDAVPMQLSAERRAKLLETLGAVETPTAGAGADTKGNAPVMLPSLAARRKQWSKQWWIAASSAAAACLAIGVFWVTQNDRVFSSGYKDGVRVSRIALEKEAKAREHVVRDLVQKKIREEARAVGGAPLMMAITRELSMPPPAETTVSAPEVKFPPQFLASGQALGPPDASALAPQQQFRGSAPLTLNSPAPSAPPPPASALSPNEATSNDQFLKDRIAGADQASLGALTFAGQNQIFSEAKARSQAGAFSPAAGAGGRGGASGRAVAPTPTNDEGVVRLEAFTVSATPDSGFAAAAMSASPRLALTLPALDAKKMVEEKQKSDADDKPLPRPAKPAAQVPADTETSTAKDPVSTFSLHVSDVSFRLAQAALARGEVPDASRIRPEEFYNAFDYGDPTPSPAEKISCRIEQSAHPVLQQRNLVRIAMKVAAAGRGAGTPLRLTVLLDTSGSMEREDRAATVKRAMAVLVSLLGPNDRITVIGFSRTPRLLAAAVPGHQAGWLVDLLARTPAEGGTNLEAALKLAGELALRHHAPGAQNRIVMLTDGAANLGNAEPAQLAVAVEALRRQGIAFDACGVGLDGLDDEILEALTRQGDGRYYALNSPADADTGFAQKLAGAFRPAAENVKLQVRFNPARVGAYRLIGFEQHRLREEDFRNDRVDAAELAAEEAAVALYQIEVLPQGEGELGEVFVRFRDPATGNMVERSWSIVHDARASAFDRATQSMQLAGTAALFAEKLRGGALANQIKLADLAPVVNSLRSRYTGVARVEELAAMFAQMRRLSGE